MRHSGKLGADPRFSGKECGPGKNRDGQLFGDGEHQPPRAVPGNPCPALVGKMLLPCCSVGQGRFLPSVGQGVHKETCKIFLQNGVAGVGV